MGHAGTAGRAPRRRSADAVLADEVGVQLHTVAGALAQDEMAVLDLRAVLEQAPAPRHVLHDVAVGDGRQRVT